MEVNEYTLEIMVRETLDTARAMTARRALVTRARPPRAPLRARLGAAPSPSVSAWAGLRLRDLRARPRAPAMGEAVIVARGAVMLRRARDDDNAQIAAIWNEAVAGPSLTTDTEPRTPQAQRAWLARHGDAHPAIVAVDGDEVLAYGSLSPYRDKPAFRATVEDSVYVKAGRRGAGLGSLVLAELLRLSGQRGYRAVMARIVADNEASRRLHARLGFGLVGIERATAFKHRRYHDIAIMQKLVD